MRPIVFTITGKSPVAKEYLSVLLRWEKFELYVQGEGTIQAEIKYTSLQGISKGCCLLLHLQFDAFDCVFDDIVF